MKIALIGVMDRGHTTLERVELSVTEDCVLSDYMISDSTYTGPGVMSNRLRHLYWWGKDVTAKKGDLIFLYTGVGKDAVSIYHGVTCRTFYWNLKHQIWNNTGDMAVLFELADWDSKIVPGAVLKLAA
jgi:hypothetical protein